MSPTSCQLLHPAVLIGAPTKVVFNFCGEKEEGTCGYGTFGRPSGRKHNTAVGGLPPYRCGVPLVGRMEQVSSDVVPETGVEPARSFGTQDFKSRASTNSATPARLSPLKSLYYDTTAYAACQGKIHAPAGKFPPGTGLSGPSFPLQAGIFWI